MSSISYAITGWNEHKEVDRLLHQIKSILKKDDEIVIQIESKSTDELKEVIKSHGLTPHIFPLNDSFIDFKNNLNRLCTKEYIFQIDGDEFLSDNLLKHLNTLLRMYSKIDCLIIPRINTLVDDSIIEDYKNNKLWIVNEDSWKNYPDLQIRLFKNKSSIFWGGDRMHTHIIGFDSSKQLDKGYELIHVKSFQKQAWQDEFYKKF